MYAEQTEQSQGEGVERFVLAPVGFSIAKVALVNILLTVLTLGIYRFWARTRLRRAYWSMVSFRGTPLEYTGTGKELFVGFLIAMVALVPIIGVGQLLLSLIPPTEIPLLVASNAVYLLVLAAFGILGLFYARRYLLTRTSWRGIHGGQDGRMKEFVILHAKAYGLTLLTLGLVQPWADAKTYNFRMGITRFGTGQFSADAPSGPLWMSWAAFYGLFILGYVLFFAQLWPLIEFTQAMEQAKATGGVVPERPKPNGLAIATALGMMLISVPAYFVYQLIAFRTFANHTRFEGMRVTCTNATSAALELGLVNLVMWVVILAVAGMVGLLVAAPFGLPGSMPIAFIAFFIAVWTVHAIATHGWFNIQVMKVLAGGLTITGPDALEEVMNRGQEAPRRGEGLADGLGDVGMVI